MTVADPPLDAAFVPDLRPLLRARPGLSLADVETGATPGFSGTKKRGNALRRARDGELAQLQRLLYANATAGARHRVLLVLQGMDTYLATYERAIDATDADHAPWYVVPTDRKWYARAVVQELLIGALAGLRLDWPGPGYDVEDMRRRLAEL